MLDAFIGTVFVCLILIGTVAICYLIMLKLLLPKTKTDYYIFLPQNKNSEGVRRLAYGTRIKLNLIGDDRHSKIVVLDCGISEEEKENLLPICKESNGIYLVQKEYIKDYFDGRI